MHAFVLAGGFATRLWPLTEKRAKPLLPLAGKPLLTHLVENIPTEIPVTVSTNAAFRNGFEEWKRTIDRTDVAIVIEQTTRDDEKIGALGALARWLQDDHMNDDILLLAGDNYFGFSLHAFLQEYRGGRTLFAAKDVQNKEEAKRFGVVLEGDPREPRASAKRIVRRIRGEESFEEKPKEPASTFVSTGCYLLPKDKLPLIIAFAKDHPDNIGGFLKHFLKKGEEIDYVLFHEPWFDVGSFDAYLAATKTLIGADLRLTRSATVEENVCEGSVVLGEGSSAHRSTLRNVVLFDHCTVEDCILEDCILDSHCMLRGIDLKGKMLREGTILTR